MQKRSHVLTYALTVSVRLYKKQVCFCFPPTQTESHSVRVTATDNAQMLHSVLIEPLGTQMAMHGLFLSFTVLQCCS